MICLDTNYLVRGLIGGAQESVRLIEWLRAGETLCASAIAWYEFSCGPVDARGLQIAESLLLGGVLPFDSVQAAEAARLFNLSGRLRRLRVDAIVAAAAIVTGSRLATANQRDFLPFVQHGLVLV